MSIFFLTLMVLIHVVRKYSESLGIISISGSLIQERIKAMNELNKNHLLTRIEAAKYLGVSSITLGLWKSTKRYDLPVVKVGRLAKYRYGDLLDFVERQTVNKPKVANDNSTRRVSEEQKRENI